jgi:hypothetical protein
MKGKNSFVWLADMIFHIRAITTTVDVIEQEAQVNTWS